MLSKHTNKLGIGKNSSLRASYTPSPARTPSSGRTPSGRTPSRTPGRTPNRTPKTSGFGSRSIDGVKIKNNSLTDGLIWFYLINIKLNGQLFFSVFNEYGMFCVHLPADWVAKNYNSGNKTSVKTSEIFFQFIEQIRFCLICMKTGESEIF